MPTTAFVQVQQELAATYRQFADQPGSTELRGVCTGSLLRRSTTPVGPVAGPRRRFYRRARSRPHVSDGRPAARAALPPDPARLRVILAHLDRQIAETDTIGTWLRLQREAVRHALSAADAPVAPASERQREQAGPLPRARPGPYKLEPKIRPDHPRPPYIHVGDCTMTQRSASSCSAAEARLALTQAVVGAEACGFCRPDTEPRLAE
ncbi:DUF6233 domain-containing protein [Streptomyces sp. NPDC127033]|uniref:DUF6233 domain-containing protein n=1 Tax=Streptomyces sp. NPDC127033 TaxID=3347110 RepID=UPI0036658B0B